MVRMVLIGFALAIAAAAGTAQAQDRPADDPGIVVRGQKGVPPREARKFVRQVVTSTEGQLARFVDPVCPFVLGLPRQYASIVEDRIRADAAESVRIQKILRLLVHGCSVLDTVVDERIFFAEENVLRDSQT